MHWKLILQLILLLADPEMVRDQDLKGLAKELSRYPVYWILEVIPKIEIETGFRNNVVSSAGFCCYTQQSPGRKRPDDSPKPSCKRMVAFTRVCLEETAIEIRYWKKHCGKSWRDAYRSGWTDCCAGPYYKKRKGKQHFRCRTERTRQIFELREQLTTYLKENGHGK